MTVETRHCNSSLAFLWFVTGAFVLLCTWWVCKDALQPATLSFGILKPFVDKLCAWGSLYRDPRALTFLVCTVTLITLLGALALRGVISYFWLGVLGLVGAQYFLLQDGFVYAEICVGFGAICFYLWSRKTKDDVWSGETVPIASRDVLTVLGLTIIAAFYRFYALNQIVNGFEGELAPYFAGATSFKGLFAANRGMYGPWAPLGILFYLPIYFTTSLFGTTIVALRASSAVVGVLTLPLFYIFARKIAGRSAACFATFFFALDALHIGWGRTDVHPHGVTTWPTLLLCISLLRSVKTPSWRWYVTLVLCMGLTWHQYPSGQSAVSIPFIALFLYLISNRFQARIAPLLVIAVLCGGGLWFIGLPLSYYPVDGRWISQNLFTLTGPRTSWGNTSDAMTFSQQMIFVVQNAAQHLWDVVQGIFYKVPYLFHQDFVPEVPGLTVRTVPWLITPLVVSGCILVLLRIRTIESCILIAWMIAALTPGILSEHAYPKRLSTFFPAMDLLAGISLGYLVTSTLHKKFLRYSMQTFVLCGCLGYAIFMADAWFSGRQWGYGVPVEERIADEIGAMIEPGTIVIADIWKDYDQGKMTYLLMDTLTNPAHRPNIWFLQNLGTARMSALVDDPASAPNYFTPTEMPWFYLWTRLRDQWDEMMTTRSWRKVVYILQQRDVTNQPNDAIKAKVMATCPRAIQHTFPAQSTFINTFVVIECLLTS